MHKVNLGLPVPGAPGNPTPSLIAKARRGVDKDKRDRGRKRETKREIERGEVGEGKGVEGDVVGLDGCLVPAIPVSVGARLVAALY